jgi:hypothetical protein
METDVVDEVLLWIVEGGVHLGDLFGEFGDVLVGGALGGEGGDRGLEHKAGLEHLPGKEAVEDAKDGERVGVEGGRAGGDKGSGAVAALENSHGGEEADSGAKARAADLKLAGEFALRGEAVAWSDLTGGDQGADVLDDLHGELTVRSCAVRGLVLDLSGGLFFHAEELLLIERRRVTRSNRGFICTGPSDTGYDGTVP